MKTLPTLAKFSLTLSLVGFVGLPALGQSEQSRGERVNQIANALSSGIATNNDSAPVVEQRATPGQLIRETMTNVDFDAMPVKLALDIWSNQTQVPLVVNWKALEVAGIDPQTPITLRLQKVPADVVLKLIVGQMQNEAFNEDRLIVDVEQWFVRVMTKREALRQSTTRLYFIGDLLMTVPNFTNAPGFDLNDALSNTNSGGSNGGGGGGGNDGGLFNDEADQEREQVMSKEDKAERIMDLIRDSIEPQIWQARGGEFASVRYMRGMLVVKAPDFVHKQIGVPFTNHSRPSATTRSNRSEVKTRSDRRYKPSGNVAGVAGRR